MVRAAGFADFRYSFGGFAVYGMGNAVYRMTKSVEGILSRSAAINRFSGFLYFTAVKR